MEWPSTLVDGDALIVREEPKDGLRFVVYTHSGPQLICRTYAEAEAQACAYAERAHAHAWYADGRGLQLVGGHRPVSPTPHHADVMSPPQNQPGDRRGPSISK